MCIGRKVGILDKSGAVTLHISLFGSRMRALRIAGRGSPEIYYGGNLMKGAVE